MTYATMMVHMDVGSPNDAVLRVAATLCTRFRAKVIGIAACQPMRLVASEADMTGDLIGIDLEEITKETSAAEASFRAGLDLEGIHLDWRSIIAREQLADYVVREARAADLLITGTDLGWSAFDSSRRVIVSNLVLKAGRPVMIVPADAALDLGVVVVAWKDTREARRAIADALPLLKAADRVVVVVEIAEAQDIGSATRRLDDVATWLDRHGIASDRLAATSIGDDAAQLRAIVQDKRAGVMVAGAYGHDRLREWVLGGVTRDLLVHPGCCAFVSH